MNNIFKLIVLLLINNSLLSQYNDAYFLIDSLYFEKNESTYDSELFGSAQHIEIFLLDDLYNAILR